jgi:hypothetical protein
MKYSTIHWGYSARGYAGNTWLTYSAAEHKAAMATIKQLGGHIHDWH